MKKQLQPVSTTPTSFKASKNFETKDSLAILTAFVSEVRKEMRKTKTVKVSTNNDEGMNHLHFVCDGFDLSFTLTERTAL